MATNIDTMAADNISRNNVAADALEQTFGKIKQVTDSAVQNLQSAGDDAKLVTTTAKMAEAQASQRTLDFASKIGTNPDAANYAMAKLVDQANAAYEAQRANADRLEAAMTPSNILKDPLQYVQDLVMYDFNVNKQKALDAKVQSAVSQIAVLNNTTQEYQRTMNAIAQPVTTETALAQGRVAQAEINNKVANLEIDGLKTNAHGITAVAQMRNSSMDIALKARDQQLQEQQVALQRESHALQRQSLQLQMEERRDARQLKQEHIAARTNILSAVNAGRQINGNLSVFKTFEEMQATMEMDPKQKEFILDQYNAGRLAETTGIASIAKDPYSAIKYVAGTNAQISDGRSKVIGFLDKIKSSVFSDPRVAPTLKKEADVSNAINSSALGAANQMLSNISNGTGNIYAPAPLAAFAQDPEFSKTFIGQNIMGPMLAGGVKDTDMKQIVGMTIDAARKGTITQAQADNELGFLAEKVKGYNNELYRYNATAGLPNMKTVNVAVSDTGSFGNLVNSTLGPNSKGVRPASAVGDLIYSLSGGENDTVIDLSNPTARGAYINKRMAQTIPPVLRQQAQQTPKIGVK